jgi:hypothetical protein
MTKKRNIVKKFDWQHFLNYVQTYDPKKHGANDAEIIFQDMLYGLGISIDEKEYSWATGFRKFKQYLVERFTHET